MTQNTQDYKVIFCDDENKPALASGEKAIWVDELFKAYPSSTDAAEKSITAVYIYYPMHENPANYNDTELKSMGATRVFAYIGIPDYHSEDTPLTTPLSPLPIKTLLRERYTVLPI